MRTYDNGLHFERDTHADVGWITSVYLGGKSPLSGGGANGVALGTNIGRIGKLDDAYPGNPEYYATPTQWSPFVTDNAVRQFYSRKEAAAWLLGIHDAAQEWLQYQRAHPSPARPPIYQRETIASVQKTEW